MLSITEKLPKMTDMQKENVCKANIHMRKLLLEFDKITQQKLVENIPKEEAFLKELEELVTKKDYDKCFELLFSSPK